MKTMSKIRMVMILLLLAISVPTFATTIDPVTEAAVNNAPTNEAKSEILLKRLEEIKDMDKSDMTRAERKALRKEVKEIKASMKAYGSGVYISVGAAIIIILLLILIF
jgi:hypothetical protein